MMDVVCGLAVSQLGASGGVKIWGQGQGAFLFFGRYVFLFFWTKNYALIVCVMIYTPISSIISKK